MMNKKAIAAFAAGATLLAGFAMATPAMAGARKDAMQKAEAVYAAEHSVRDARKALEKDKLALIEANSNAALLAAKAKSAKAASDAAQKALDDANKALDAAAAAYADKKIKADTAKSKNYEEWKANYSKDTDKDVKAEYEKLSGAVTKAQAKVDDANHSYTVGKVTANSLTLAGVAEGLQALADAAAESVSTLKEQVTYDESTLKTAIEYLNALNGVTPDQNNPDQTKPDKNKPDHTTPDHTNPVTPAKPDSKLEAVKNVLAKRVDADAASHVFAEKKEAYAKAAATLAAAKAELDAAEHDKAVAAQNLSDFEASGVNDSAKLQSLKEAVARAEAHVVRTTTAFNKALVDFNDAKTADLAAKAAYKAAKDAYDEAYNAAIKLGVNPALLPSVTAIDPLSPAFPQLAQAQKIYADALAGKFGAAAQKAVQKAEAKAQAAAPAAAAGKAGAAAGAAAKGELAGMGAKGGNGHGGKAGEKLGNAGVGVALTALAASMLAGMGAAVRKMRH